MFPSFSAAESNNIVIPTKLKAAVLYSNPAKDLTLPTKLSNDSGGNSYSAICGNIVTTSAALTITELDEFKTAI